MYAGFAKLHDSDSEQDELLCGKMSPGPMPPRTVAETSCIKSTRATDILAVVETVGVPRINRNDRTIIDVTLIDDSTASNGKLATVVISVWGKEKAEALGKIEGQAMVFFNLSATYKDGRRNIDHYGDKACFQAVSMFQKIGT